MNKSSDAKTIKKDLSCEQVHKRGLFYCFVFVVQRHEYFAKQNMNASELLLFKLQPLVVLLNSSQVLHQMECNLPFYHRGTSRKQPYQSNQFL